VSAALRWTLVVAAVGAAGFAAGRYLASHQSGPAVRLTLPVIAPSSLSPAGSPSVPAAASPHAPATLREIMKLDSDFTRSAAIYLLAAGMNEEGVERLLDEVESIDRESERRTAASILYQRYAELDPAAAVEHMMRRKEGFDTNWLYAVFYSWARTDLDGAVSRAATLDDRDRYMAGTAIVRSRDDLPSAEREALGPKLNTQVAVRDPYMSRLRSAKAAESAWQSALTIRDREARQSEQYSVIYEWARLDPHAAIRAIESLQSRADQYQFLHHAVQAWSEKEPHAAVDWLLARPPSHHRTELLSNALGSLAMKDPDAAMTIAQRVPESQRDQVLMNVFMNWGHSDPEAAAAWLAKQDDRQRYSQALVMVASGYVMRDPEGALQWAETLSGEQSRMVMGQVIPHIAQDDPERAASLVSQLDEGPERERAISNIAQAWAQWDPRAALAWATKQPASDTTSNVYRGIFQQWGAIETDAALSQLNFIMDTDARNGAILGILDGAQLEPALTEQLFQRMEGAEARRLAAGRVYYHLRDKNPQRAERYRIEAGISEEQAASR
jgi:hypothetical protein